MNENVNETTVETTDTTENVGAEAKTYTEAEVMELIQREGDKRVSSALKKQQAKYEKQLSLSKLDESQRATAEKDMRISELEQKLADYEIERNRSELKSVLSARGLSAEFCDLIAVTDNLEESQERIDKLDKLFKLAVAEEVKKRLTNGRPQVGTTDGKLTKEAFDKMSIAEKQRLYNTDPTLYKQMSGAYGGNL